MKIILIRKKEDPHWKLIIDKEDRDFMGDKPICQCCKGFINMPFYVCGKTHKWYCRDCELKKLDKNEADFCIYRNINGHTHYCIKEVEEIVE